MCSNPFLFISLPPSLPPSNYCYSLPFRSFLLSENITEEDTNRRSSYVIHQKETRADFFFFILVSYPYHPSSPFLTTPITPFTPTITTIRIYYSF